MKVVEVKEQVRLPLSKCMELVLSGLRFRLFRAAITVVIIALAVAFLMTMLSESLVTRNVAAAIEAQTYPRELLREWVSRLSLSISDDRLSRDLARTPKGSPRWKEFAAWGDLTDAQLDELQRIAVEQRKYLAYFARIDEGTRSMLVGRARGLEILQALQDPAKFREFADKHPHAAQKIESVDEFRQFLSEWQRTVPLRQAIRTGHESALKALRPLLSGAAEPATTASRPVADRAAADVREFLAAMTDPDHQALLRQGFQMSPEEKNLLRKQALLNLHADRIVNSLDEKKGVVRNRLAKELDEKPADITGQMLLDFVRSSDGARWLLNLTENTEDITSLRLSEERIREVARHSGEMARLRDVEASVAEVNSDDDADNLLGFSTRTLWLIVVSFIVCTVGIVNAMLMSVTERFREIATMKCLGATDRFIMINFILESCMQGIAGGIIGAALGFLLGVLRAGAKYGFLALENLPVTQMLAVAGASLVVGVILSALAAVYPAWVAARLAPMEAMRIE
ncbi:MAG TPA: hypothetical protein DCX07_05305 [Phycisphaerales bacterium]|nr:hypothetical protein [Phycisphaerales bacterium]